MSPQATTLIRDLWIWCLEKNILLSVQHLPGKLNVIANLESKMMRDQSDWMLSPIYISANESTATILQLETRPSGRSNRCIPPGLDKSKELCQSPLESNRKGSSQGETTGGKSDTNSSCMEITTMVPPAPKPIAGLPMENPTSARSAVGGADEISQGNPTTTSHVA